MKNWHREALEAVGMLGRKSTLRNRLNEIVAQSEDSKLRELAADVIRQFDYSSLNTSHTSLRDSNSVKTEMLIRYCQERTKS